MINIVTLLPASEARSPLDREKPSPGELFGPTGSSTIESVRDILRQLKRFGAEGGTAGLLTGNDDQRIVEDHLKALAQLHLVEVARTVEIRTYQLTDAGLDVLKALAARSPIV